MAKKSIKKTKTELVESINRHCCQYCNSHKNHPSFCKTKKTYVGRKQEACDKFKEVK